MYPIPEIRNMAIVRDLLQTNRVQLWVTDEIHIFVLKQSCYLSWGLTEVGMFQYVQYLFQ